MIPAMYDIWKELKKLDEDYLIESSELYKGIFWIVDEENIEKNKDYCFLIPTSPDGVVTSLGDEGVAKSGNTYNHEAVWKSLAIRLTHKLSYNYYPRGRVEISNGVAKIFLNGNINYEKVIDFIKSEFNLTKHNGIKEIKVITDNSRHYLCHLDDGWVPAKGGKQ